MKSAWRCAWAIGLACGPLHAGLVTVRLGTAPRSGPSGKVVVRRGKAPTCYVPKTKVAPKLDGKLDDAAWKQAKPLQLSRTLDGAGRAAQPTEVRLLRDATTLYVAVKAFEPMLGKLQATRRGHDGSVWSDDGVEIFLGTGGGYCHFGINALGSTYDARGRDGSWNSGFKAAAGRGRSEYTLEIAIPLTKVAGSAKLPGEWIANFNRNRRVTGSLEESSWSPTYSGDSHVPSRFGRMLLSDPPKPQPGKEPVKPAVKKEALEVLPAGNGLGVARFDLSRVPKGAKVHRADLLIFRTTRLDGRMDQARVNVDVYPLFAAFRSGGDAPAEGKPLAIRGPWYDRIDATDAVRKWVSGRTNGGFFVKSCPFWKAEATCLDVWYEGRPEDVPEQVTAVRALHRAGQTFITWKETTDPIGRDDPRWGQVKMALDNLDRDGRLRYCVYRHGRPITADNLHEAELIARVKPLSGWNVNGRSLGRAVDQYIASAEILMTGQWNPWWQARMDGKYGTDCPVDPLAIEDGKPLPRGRGLYVHTAGRKGRAYYAVVACLDGVQNTRDVSAANSLARPVAEVEGIGVPVLQRELPKMPFFNYPQKRLHYVRWVGASAGAMVNVPSQYYNWSAGVPERLGKSVPLELNFHRDGYSYWRTHYRIERDSVVLCPHDFPVQTYWYGYHESLGTLKSFRQGLIHPYTERRLLAFIDWASAKWPIDRKRILVTGCRGGASGSGALHLGLRHPEVFNLAIAGHPMLDYTAAAQATDRRGAAVAQAMQRIWGRVDWDIHAAGDEPFWPQHDLLRLVRAAPAEADLPYVTMTSSGGSAHPFYKIMLSKGRGVLANFAWGGARYIPVSNSGTYPNVIRQDIRKGTPYLAFGPEAVVDKRRNSQLNGEFGWRDVVEKPGRFEVTLFLRGRGDSAADVTLRRCETFKIAKGKTYLWSNETKDRKGNPVKQNGKVVADADGLLTVPGVQFGGKLLVTAK